MSIAAYIRISTTSQRSDAQRAEIEAWLRSHGHDPAAATWFEDAESGDKADRPALARLKTAIFRGEVTTVVIWKIDRLARDMRDGINLLSDWVERGVRVVSITQAIDLSGVAGKLVAAVLLAVAEIELANIRERQAAGIAQAKMRGAYKGRRPGSTKASPARAKELKAQGLRSSEIMRALGIRSRATLARYLSEGGM